MKHLLLDLLSRTEPSTSTINNCIALISRESSSNHPRDSHDELLRRGRDAALDTAQILEQASLTARNSHIDHAELIGLLTVYCETLSHRQVERGYHTSARAVLGIVCEDLKELLHKHETARTLRALRNT